MRRILALVALGSLLTTMLPGTVAGAAPERFTDHAVTLQCELSGNDGFVSTFVTDSSEFGAFADLVFWAAPAEPFEEAPTVVSINAEVDSTDTSLHVDYELVEFDETLDPPFGDTVGTGVLDATLTPDGDPIAIDDRFRDGNRWVQIEGSTQPLAIGGSLTIPSDPADIVFDLAGCVGSIDDITFFGTNPSSLVQRFDSAFVSCFWETDSGSVSLFGVADAFGAFSDLFVVDASGEYQGFSEPVLTGDAFTATYDLFAAPDGEVVVGSAQATGTVTETGDITRTTDGSGKNQVKITRERLSVAGTLEISTPGGAQTLAIDDEACEAAQEHVFDHSVRPAGPKPGPLANDAPDGAIALRVGRTARVVTGGNAEAPEEPCVASDGEGGTVELPIAFTAWWTFSGDGGEMTVDTAGSDFDTIAGIYVDDGGSLTNLACVDDVFEPDFSLQARVSVDTVAGTTYYVQVGGFGNQGGHLVVTLS